MMIGLIGGTGFAEIDEIEIQRKLSIETPFGSPSGKILIGNIGALDLAFLARHGEDHKIPPHKINYRANIWALKEIGVSSIIAAAAVGGIRSDMTPGKIAIPDQIIDYTHSRSAAFFEEDLEQVTHIDFTFPYSETIRQNLSQAAAQAGIDVIQNGAYGCTQGPRLETAAEIKRMERDGCALVGMTGMPEASLAREAELDYACCAIVANWAAGKGNGLITMDDILLNLNNGTKDLVALLSCLQAK